MFRNLLVPLDGSSLAEAAVPVAARLAERLGASVALVHVIERGAPSRVHGESHLRDAERAKAYLAELAARVFPAGGEVQQHVHAEATTDVARGIAEHIRELGRDLVVLCAHGRGGLRDLVSGPVGQQVLAHGRAPVLVVRASAAGPAPDFELHRLLVPLDERPEHAAALAPAETLARAFGASIRLLRVVPTRGTLAGEDVAGGLLLPRTTAAMLDIATVQAEEALAAVREGLAARGVEAIVEVTRGDPATSIVRATQDRPTDLVVLGTHGRKGMGAFWARSVADRVYRRTRLPLLLVPAG
ncbi:MAG: universal stress protein [Deltaproteobacteria bacterium]|nr:universal stress protein [Deltaproteobacteria bacterium]